MTPDPDSFLNALSIDLADAARFIKQLHADAVVAATEIARLTRERDEAIEGRAVAWMQGDEARAKLATLEADRRVHAVDVVRRKLAAANCVIERVRTVLRDSLGANLADDPEPAKEE